MKVCNNILRDNIKSIYSEGIIILLHMENDKYSKNTFSRSEDGILGFTLIKYPVQLKCETNIHTCTCICNSTKTN